MSIVELHYRATGTGIPVIILHGLFGSSRNWSSLSKKLADHYQIITPDLRNHGESPHTDKMDYAGMAEDVLALAESLNLAEYTVIGHSMGGKVGMQMALTMPQVVNRLLVMDIAPVEYRHRYGKLFTAMENLPLNKINNRREAEELFCPIIGDINLCRFLLQNLVRTENGFDWRINLQALESNIDTIAAFPDASLSRHYDGPCLFLGGAESDFILPEHATVIKRLFPAADMQWIKGAGHMLHVEQPEAVLQKTRAFLR